MLQALKKEHTVEMLATLKDEPAKLAGINHNLSDKRQTIKE